jgi:hypothetical protein
MTPQSITTIERAAINRANSQHSTGPKTHRDLDQHVDDAEDFVRDYIPEETDDLEPAAENED